MDRIERKHGAITFTDPFPLLQRIVLFSFGLVPLAAPYELLIRPAWQEGSFVFAIIPILISLGSVAVTIVFVLGAFLGAEQQVSFDSTLRMVIHRSRSSILGRREQRHPFGTVERVELRTHEWSDGPVSHNIVLIIARGPEVEFGRFGSKEEAARERETLLRLLGMPH